MKNLSIRPFVATVLLLTGAVTATLSSCADAPGITLRASCCQTTADCVQGYLCNVGTCRPACSQQADCNRGETCEGTPLVCAPDQPQDNGCTLVPQRSTTSGSSGTASGGVSSGGASSGGTSSGTTGSSSASSGGASSSTANSSSASSSTATSTVTSTAQSSSSGGQVCPGQDEFEPNNTPDQAAGTSRRQFGGVVCGQDQDWFRVETSVGDSVTATIRVLSGSADGLSAQLTSPLGEVLATNGVDPMGNLTLELANAPGPLRLVLFSPGGETVRWNTRVNVTTSGTCVNDGLEPNDSPGAASQVDTQASGVLCPGDADWLVMRAGGMGATLTVSADRWTVRVADLANQTLLTRNGQGTASVEIPPGPDFVLVELTAPGNAPAQNWFVLLQAGGSCPDDPFEPNNDTSNASFLEGINLLQMCPANDDFFLVNVTAPGQVVKVEVVPLGVMGDIDVQLLDLFGNLVASSTNPPPQGESITFFTTAAQPLFLRVLGFPEGGQTQGTYQLSITVEGGTTLCVEDSNEPNDDVGTATSVGANDQLLGNCCPDNVDVFKLADAATTPHFVRLAWEPGVTMGLEIFNPDGTTVTSDANASGFLQLNTFSAAPRLARLVCTGPTSYALTTNSF